jgi:tRNA dimethylallyltransferase
MLGTALARTLEIAHAPKPLVVVTGPTGSGKTGLSIELALALKGEGITAEIINADSRQCYKLMDIGTAKITETEMSGVPHHLFSVLDPKEPATIAWYQDVATAQIADCHARGVLPMLVGGSMLYLSSVIDGLKPLPSDPALRAKLQKIYDQDEGVTLQKELMHLDPESGASVERRNAVYLIRAVEICRLTGKPASEVRTKSPSPYALVLFFLDLPVEVLDARIVARTRVLLDAGWVEEVESLRQRGYDVKDPGFVSHGYREILFRLKKGKNVAEVKTDPSVIAQINTVTRQYAKRQRTWWRRDERVIRLQA